MIIPPRKLQHVETFKADEGINETIDYEKIMYDKITVHYYKKWKGWFRTRESEWTEEFKFIRTTKPTKGKEGWTTFSCSNDYHEMMDQLKEKAENNIISITKDDYDFFKETHPERFI